MSTIVIASKNPVKSLAVQKGFARMFPGIRFIYQTIESPSGVSAQPSSDAETRLGALNRATNAAQNWPDAGFWVGIEGGIEDYGREMAAFAWVVVKSTFLTGKGRSGTFFLPPPVASLIRDGKELGEADDLIFDRNNSKQEEGAIGLLTGNVIDRTSLYEHAVILALLPFKNESLYRE